MELNIFRKVILTLFLTTAIWPCFFAPSVLAEGATLHISQVQITGGTGKTAWDFVEIYNPGAEAVNLKGHRLVKRTATGASDTTIKSWTADACVPPGGYYLWANSEFTEITAPPDITTSGTISNDNGVALRLGEEDTGTLVHSLAWGSADNGFGNVSASNPTANMALVRQSDGTYAIAASSPRNSAGAGWSGSCAAPESAAPASSGSSNSGTGGLVSKSSDVFISEILANPLGEDGGAEKVELRNNGLYTVNLSGWYLQDSSEGVKPTAYKLPSEILHPQSYIVITLPTGYFSLNNTGGEALALYDGNKVFMDSADFSGEAPEGQSFQKVGGVWLWSEPTLGSDNYVFIPPSSGPMPVFVNEIMPNPEGDNAGRQWVEFKNQGKMPFSLKGYILDRGSFLSEAGNTALVLDDKAVVPAGGYLAVTIPEDKFVFSQQGNESLRFFSPQAKLIEQINFSEIPEGKSYQKGENNLWEMGLPTMGLSNILPAALKVEISEILPDPKEGEEEFVELRSLEERVVSLENFVLRIGNFTKKFNEGEALPEKGYWAIFSEDLPGRLRNSGQEVVLMDPYGRVLSQVNYPAAKKGQAYALAGGGFAWTTLVSPGEENGMVLGETTSLPSESAGDGAASAKKESNFSPKTPSSNQYADLLAVNRELLAQVKILEKKIDQISALPPAQQVTVSSEAQGPSSEGIEPEEAENNYVFTGNSGAEKNYYLILAVGAFIALFFVFKKYFFGKK